MDLLHVLEEEFNSVDTDKDGFLNKAEIGTCLEKFGFKKERAAEFIKVFDLNKDGKISKDEFMKAAQKKIADREISCAWLRRTFRTIDKDRSGKLSAKELKDFLQSQHNFIFPSAVDQWIEDNDRDGDKELSYEEFLGFVKNIL
ncbi:hypothetical protein EG68_05267 [Paragonimus skrjabini miyazakii]|uniref:EF-hand domain-containing protein n=1 Tax=Paragonimus skrjabini miyazakii TaxID=59628 RepID=A0A8S9Z110_9TREM|nr:hypothetical protein EG68_05267 [Paragonimus skrjabini miyazakii]